MDERWYVLDLETSWLNRFSGFAPGQDPVAEFFRASAASDFRSSRFFLQHEGSQLLEMASSRPLFFGRPASTWGGFSSSHVHLAFQGEPFRLSRFSENLLRVREGDIFQVAGRPGTEEEAARLFFRSLHRRIKEGPVTLAGWNPSFDLSFLETLAWRYERLAHWRGYLARQFRAGRLRVVALEEPLFELLWRYGQARPDFARRRFYVPSLGRHAASAAELRRLPVWSVERVLGSLTGPDWPAFQSHAAAGDVVLEQRLYEALRRAVSLSETEGFDQALRQAGLIGEQDTAAAFFWRLTRTVERTEAQESVVRGAARARGAVGEFIQTLPRRVWIGLAAAAAAVASWMAYSSRRDRQTTLEGLEERGLSALLRKQSTSFGSGWRGLDEEPWPWEPYAAILGLPASWRLASNWILSERPDWLPSMYRIALRMEWASPARLLMIAGLSRRLSSYVPSSFSLTAEDLVAGGREAFESGARFGLTRLGQHLQGLLGQEADLAELLRQGGGRIEFIRRPESGPFLHLTVGGVDTGYRVRFMSAGTATAVSSFRAGLRPLPVEFPQEGPLWSRLLEYVRLRKRIGYGGGVWIDPRTGTRTAEAAEGAIRLQPYLALREGRTLRNLAERANMAALQLLERANRLLNEAGVGIRPGTYSNAFQLFGRLMAGRVLPAYLIYTGLRYADYLTGHRVSDAAWDLYAKARIAHAELTDRVPGWRRAVEWNREHLPGPAYAPLALPAAGAATGALLHWLRAAAGAFDRGGMELRRQMFRRWTLRGAAAGLLLAAPFLPGMLGSRRTAEQWRRIFSGEEPVEIRTGRWWDLGDSPWRGRRIVAVRPHRYVLHKTRADMTGRYGSEADYWAHHPLLHPIRWFRDPYWLERKFYYERPYPVTSPAFSNVPIVGPLLAATIGRLFKPPRLMHEGEWDPRQYQLFSDRLERSRTRLLPPAEPREEFRPGDAMARVLERLEDLVGLPGFLLRSLRRRAGLSMEDSSTVYLQGSRQMDSSARRYYEQELGAMTGVSPEGGLFGFSEPLRRFVQREDATLEVNDIPNRMPSWLPGGDYFVNFRRGDPYIKIPQGHLRLPGPGYEALHPHLKGVDPEQYPLLDRLAILADVAPWSRQYFRLERQLNRSRLSPEDRERFEKIRRQAAAVRESTASTEPRLRGPATEISGTVVSAGPEGVRLKEYPGRLFRWSGLDMPGAAFSAAALRERNQDLARAAAIKRRRAVELIASRLRPGTRIRAVIEASSLDSEQPRAVFFAGGENLNRRLVDEGLAVAERRLAGPEWLAAEPAVSRWLASYGEAMLTVGRKAWYNPLRWIPWAGHTKIADSMDSLERYRREERMELDRKRWDRPIQDFLFGWLRGLQYRLTGRVQTPKSVQERDDLERLVDYLRFLQGLRETAAGRVEEGRKLIESTVIGADLAGDPRRVRGLLGREGRYFERFVQETDPDRRREILESASPRLAEALVAQWAAQRERIRQAEGLPPAGLIQQGRFLPEPVRKRLAARARSTGLSEADLDRAAEIAHFFASRGLRLPAGDPEAERQLLDPSIDPEDIKVKILKWEGRDLHDYNVFRDRAALLWRKPWLDGVVRTLVSGDRRSEDEMRKAVEKAIADARNGGRAARGRGWHRQSRVGGRRIVVEVREDEMEQLRQQVRRNPERYAA